MSGAKTGNSRFFCEKNGMSNLENLENLFDDSSAALERARNVLRENPDLIAAGFFPFIYKGDAYLINDIATAALLSTNPQPKLLLKDFGVDIEKVIAVLPPGALK